MNKKKYYITFGQVHTHRVPNHTLDKDCVALFYVETYAEGRKRAEKLFGDKFAFDYTEENPPDMKYFPRGLIEIK